MKYIVGLTVQLDSAGAPTRGVYSDIALRSAAANALNKVMDSANDWMPAGLKLFGANAMSIVPIEEKSEGSVPCVSAAYCARYEGRDCKLLPGSRCPNQPLKSKEGST